MLKLADKGIIVYYSLLLYYCILWVQRDRRKIEHVKKRHERYLKRLKLKFWRHSVLDLKNTDKD